MSYCLLGTGTSPYTRRIRLLLANLEYELLEISPYDGEEAKKVSGLNPVNQIPILIHNELKIWDSRQIFNYLNSIHHFEEMSWDKENTLTVIDGLMASGVTLMQLIRSGFNLEDDFMLSKRSHERMKTTLNYLRPVLKEDKWDFQAMSLYSFFDWANFRGILKIESDKDISAFMKKHQMRPEVLSSVIV